MVHSESIACRHGTLPTPPLMQIDEIERSPVEQYEKHKKAGSKLRWFRPSRRRFHLRLERA
jgi:hypothetical protein